MPLGHLTSFISTQQGDTTHKDDTNESIRFVSIDQNSIDAAVLDIPIDTNKNFEDKRYYQFAGIQNNIAYYNQKIFNVLATRYREKVMDLDFGSSVLDQAVSHSSEVLIDMLKLDVKNTLENLINDIEIVDVNIIMSDELNEIENTAAFVDFSAAKANTYTMIVSVEYKLINSSEVINLRIGV